MKRFLYIAAVAALLAAPADSSGAELAGSASIGVGILDIDNESYKFGEYSGLAKDGAYLLGSADIGRYSGPYYLEFAASDIGLDSRELFLRGGQFGRFDSFISFSQTPRLISNNSRTFFDGVGSSNLTLPAGFVRGTNTPALTNIGDNLQDVKLELKRKKAALGFSERLRSGFGYSLAVSREDKEGLKSIGGTVGTSGSPASARGVILPEPVDYRVDELRAGLDWQKEASYIRFDYLLSDFDNSIETLSWESPFTTVDFARISLPPDNRHQRFSLSGGTALPFYSTRVNFLAEYGMMEQDEKLLPFSVNLPENDPANIPPRESAEAEIRTKTLVFNAASRPAPRLGLNLRYRYYSTDNRTPEETFVYLRNDNTVTTTTLTSEPFDYTSNNLSLDGSYFLSGATTLRAGYEKEVVKRSHRDAEKTRENTLKAGVQSGYFGNLSLGLNVAYSERKAEEGDTILQIDLADRDRTKVSASATYLPSAALAFSAAASYFQDDFDNSALGLQVRKGNTYTVDANWTFSREAAFYGFYTRERIDTGQVGRTGGNLDWAVNHDEDIDTAGIGVNFGFLENRLVFKTDYSYSQSTARLTFLPGRPPMPDLVTRLHSAALTGTYNIDKNLSLSAGYRYENYRSDDWQTDVVDPGSADIANVITLSGPVQDYEAHQALLFLTYRFGS
ncbi:MAG: MtrB/PioB family decaheme-associated outer membrane protein [Thermodesulfobacteriota bacterium]|nr:MAG: MtrB/PioB family decaheme-associated outer membrane protein [Thermodesulfobacteriota bacterium]